MLKVASYLVIYCLHLYYTGTATSTTTITTSTTTTSNVSEITTPAMEIITINNTEPESTSGHTTEVKNITTVSVSTTNETSQTTSESPFSTKTTNSTTSSNTTHTSTTSESKTGENVTTTSPLTNSTTATGHNEPSQTTIGSGPKESSLSLEEKQKRNGITSAVICVGSLIFIGLAYLSSFVDKPSEKISRDTRKHLEGQMVKDNKTGTAQKKISFDESAVHQNIQKNQVKQRQNGTPNEKERTETAIDNTEMVSIDEKISKVQNEQRKRMKDRPPSGWGILTTNPKYFDDYQPQRTNTNIEKDVKL